MDSETNCQQKNLFTAAVIFTKEIPFKTSRSYSTRCLSGLLGRQIASFFPLIAVAVRKNVELIKNSSSCPIFHHRPAFVPGTFDKGGCRNAWWTELKWRYCHLLNEVFSMKKPIGYVAAGNPFSALNKAFPVRRKNDGELWKLEAIQSTKFMSTPAQISCFVIFDTQTFCFRNNTTSG